jgi:hypothetical protein
MPAGKPAGVMCVNLDSATLRCVLWGSAQYPDLCRQFAPTPDVCGSDRREALQLIAVLELATGPSLS